MKEDQKRDEEPERLTLPTDDYAEAVDYLRYLLGTPATWTNQTRTNVFDAFAVMYRAGRRAVGMPLNDVARAVSEAYQAGRKDEARSFLSDVIGYRYIDPDGGPELVLDPADVTIVRRNAPEADGTDRR